MNQLLSSYGMKIVSNRHYAAGVALAFAFLSFFDVPVGWLSTVIIGLVTLHRGLKNGAFIIAWAILPAVAMLYLGYTSVFINILLLRYLLIWIFAGIFRKYQNWGLLLQIAMVLGILAVCGVHLFIPDIGEWWLTQLNTFLKEMDTSNAMLVNVKFLQSLSSYVTLLATGTMALIILLSNLMNLLLARWWQLILKSSRGLRQEFYQIRVHSSTILALLFVILGVFTQVKLFMDLLPLVLMPFIIAGLSLYHAFLVGKKRATLWLVLFYVLLILLSPYVLILLALLGVIDSVVDLRKRWSWITVTE